jgi:hypothetical protein
MLGDGEVLEDGGALVGAAEAGTGTGGRAEADERAAGEVDAAGIGLEGAVEEADDGALAGAIGADQRVDLALLEVEGDVAHGEDPAERLGETPRLQERCGQGLSPAGR